MAHIFQISHLLKINHIHISHIFHLTSHNSSISEYIMDIQYNAADMIIDTLLRYNIGKFIKINTLL